MVQELQHFRDCKLLEIRALCASCRAVDNILAHGPRGPECAPVDSVSFTSPSHARPRLLLHEMYIVQRDVALRVAAFAVKLDF